MACDLSTLQADSACWLSPSLTKHQQKLMLVSLYIVWGQAVGADMPLGVSEAPDFAKCWQPLTDDQLRAFEILAVINGISVTTPTTITPADIMPDVTCINSLSDHELDRIIGALKCSLFMALGVPV